MNPSSHQERHSGEQGMTRQQRCGELSRRVVLAGAAITTVVAAVGSTENPAYARIADQNSSQDMMAFLVLSSALTGVQISGLAPEFSQGGKSALLDADPGVDPFNIKNDYFNWINGAAAPTFEKLLQIARDHVQSLPDIVTAVNASDDTRFLARSIVLLWLLGSWYKPEDLRKFSSPEAPRAPIPSQIVSAKAYTLGFVWQIAQAHPMGYSNLQFGYWSRQPVDPNDKKSPLGSIINKS
jgi:hypothetical protein